MELTLRLLPHTQGPLHHLPHDLYHGIFGVLLCPGYLDTCCSTMYTSNWCKCKCVGCRDNIRPLSSRETWVCSPSSLYSFSPPSSFEISTTRSIHVYLLLSHLSLIVYHRTAMGLMFFGLYVGPLVGPNIGGGLTYHWSWRATFWFCFIYAATACIGMMLFTVETYRPANFSAPPTTLQPSPSELPLKPAIELEELGVENNNDVELKAKANESTSNADGLAIELGTTPATPPHITKKPFNPIQSLLFLRYHFVYPVAICTGVAFGVMFTLETIMPELFQKNYHLNSWQVPYLYPAFLLFLLFSPLLSHPFLPKVIDSLPRR